MSLIRSLFLQHQRRRTRKGCEDQEEIRAPAVVPRRPEEVRRRRRKVNGGVGASQGSKFGEDEEVFEWERCVYEFRLDDTGDAVGLWSPEILHDDERDGGSDGDEVVVPSSAPVMERNKGFSDKFVRVGGVISLEPRKKINLWNRRTMAQPKPLQLHVAS